MPRLFLLSLPALMLALAACDEATMADATETRQEARGISSCERAVRSHTDAETAIHNPSIAVVEVNQYVIDVPEQSRWLCYTDDTGRAKALVRLGDVI